MTWRLIEVTSVGMVITGAVFGIAQLTIWLTRWVGPAAVLVVMWVGASAVVYVWRR